jgi:P27 family predicted phage terminase small subunit
MLPEPLPGPGCCVPPPDLSEGARRIWAELEAAGLLRPRYLGSFAVYCEARAAWRMAADLVAKGGPVVMRDGALISNPASREVTRYRFIMRAFGSDFGASPLPRGRRSASSSNRPSRAARGACSVEKGAPC